MFAHLYYHQNVRIRIRNLLVSDDQCVWAWTMCAVFFENIVVIISVALNVVMTKKFSLDFSVENTKLEFRNGKFYG